MNLRLAYWYLSPALAQHAVNYLFNKHALFAVIFRIYSYNNVSGLTITLTYPQRPGVSKFSCECP